MTRRRALALSVLLLSCSSTQPRTEVLVTIDAEPSVRAMASTLHVVVRGGPAGALQDRADQTLGAAGAPIGWPVDVAILPAGGDALRVFEIEATALDGTTSVGRVRAISSFVPARTLALRLVLEDCCRAVAATCASDQTCRSCACSAAMVDPHELPNVGADAGGLVVDAAVVEGGVDSGVPDADSGTPGDAGVGCGPIVPTEEATLVASDGEPNDLFGYSVAMSSDGDRAIVGTPQDGASDGGSARVFRHSGTTWTEEATLVASGTGIQNAGISVALNSDGSRAIVGVYSDTTAGGAAAGSARVFVRTGTSWAEEAMLVASDGALSDKLGWSVSLSAAGDRAVVGAPLDDTGGGIDAGSARVFVRATTTWTEEATLLAATGAAGDEFGHSVALSSDGTRAIVGAWSDDTVGGADAGSARVYVRAGSTWSEETTLLAAGGAAGERFGISVALSSDGSRALVGTDRDDTAAGVDAGSARVFGRSATAWAEESTLQAADGLAGDEFGFSVALSSDGTRALVGVVWDDTAAGTDAGSARLFARTATAWSEQAPLLAVAGAAADQFGASVALSSDGSRALVGAPQRAGDAGAATFFATAGALGRAAPDGHCYVLVNEPLTASGAEMTCAAVGGHLVTIGSTNEQAIAVMVAMGTAAWIGATDEGSEGAWRWTDGEPWMTPHWETTQPDNAGGAENCAAIYFPDGSWADVACGSMYPGVCEIP